MNRLLLVTVLVVVSVSPARSQQFESPSNRLTRLTPKAPVLHDTAGLPSDDVIIEQFESEPYDFAVKPRFEVSVGAVFGFFDRGNDSGGYLFFPDDPDADSEHVEFGNHFVVAPEATLSLRRNQKKYRLRYYSVGRNVLLNRQDSGTEWYLSSELWNAYIVSTGSSSAPTSLRFETDFRLHLADFDFFVSEFDRGRWRHETALGLTFLHYNDDYAASEHGDGYIQTVSHELTGTAGGLSVLLADEVQILDFPLWLVTSLRFGMLAGGRTFELQAVRLDGPPVFKEDPRSFVVSLARLRIGLEARFPVGRGTAFFSPALVLDQFGFGFDIPSPFYGVSVVQSGQLGIAGVALTGGVNW